jgi:hypothetical protein
MKSSQTYELLVERMHEIALVPPQELGPFTLIYRKFIPLFKNSFWKSAGIFALMASLILYVVLGAYLIKIVSVLQYGF